MSDPSLQPLTTELSRQREESESQDAQLWGLGLDLGLSKVKEGGAWVEGYRKACRAGALRWEDLQPVQVWAGALGQVPHCRLDPEKWGRGEGCFKSRHKSVTKLGLDARSCWFPTMF